jgi:hypothetical protein
VRRGPRSGAGGAHLGCRPADCPGIGAILKITFVDAHDVSHRLLVRGPYVRCRDHEPVPEREPLATALASMAKRRSCLRIRIGWQRHMLAAEPKAHALRSLPPSLDSYLDEQTTRHLERLDHALGDAVDERARRRWHDVGWRAAPTLAARYQEVGVEAAVAFLAYRRGFDPSVVRQVLDDPTSALGGALKESKRQGYTVRELQLGQHALVTDDLPYEPFDPVRSRTPSIRPGTLRDWHADLRLWLADGDAAIAIEDVLETAGLKDDAMRAAASWARTVAVGYERSPEKLDAEIVLRGLTAGIEAFRPSLRRLRRATPVVRER